MKILLGVSGGIAAYKSAALVRALKKRGDDVRVVMTAGAQEFIAPLTLQVLSENPVGTQVFDAAYESEIGHIDLARWADAVLIAPATANLIARMSAGMADDLLTTVVLATTAPVVVAPAMNTQMYLHPSTTRNLATLSDFGYVIVDPEAGLLACKEVGPGRLPDPHVLLEALNGALLPDLLAGTRVLVSAGPTREFIDPARFISNPSTGKMGFALAKTARALGAQVTLVTGPSELLSPYDVERVNVVTAAEMSEEILSRAADFDWVIKAAAVADLKPRNPSAQKRSKGDLPEELPLARNTDILKELGSRFGPGGRPGPTLVGFAAESEEVERNARAKLLRKNAHYIIANQIGGPRTAFGADESSAVVISRETISHLGPLPKDQLAVELWRALTKLGPRP